MRRRVIRIINFCICLIAFIRISAGQSIPKTVLGSSGTEYSNTTISLQWTLGEMSIAQYKKDELQLDEGFHAEVSNTELSTSINNLHNVSSFEISPNPTLGLIRIPIDVGMSRDNKILIYSNQGTLMETKTAIDQNQLDLSSLQKGIYYLLIVQADKTGSISKIVKM